jgi:integrase
MVGYAGATLTRFFEAILDRHRQHGATIGVNESRLRAWLTAMQKGMGMPKRDKFFLLPMHIRCALQLPRDTLKHIRDVAMMVVGTMCALRCGELARLDVCDLLWDFDGVDTLAILLWYRKNDGMKRGLFPRIGRGTTEATCPITLLKEYVQRTGLRPSKRCTKGMWRRSACNACGRLFRNTTAGGTRIADSGEGDMVQRSVIATAVKESLARIGVVPDKFSPVSMRRGGVSAALAAGVNETLWKLQSGHRSISWQNYADVVTRDQLYEFSNAFGL